MRQFTRPSLVQIMTNQCNELLIGPQGTKFNEKNRGNLNRKSNTYIQELKASIVKSTTTYGIYSHLSRVARQLTCLNVHIFRKCIIKLHRVCPTSTLFRKCLVDIRGLFLLFRVKEMSLCDW